jgi:1-deoxy-D-xylulose-5-phosphate reductoisomerase
MIVLGCTGSIGINTLAIAKRFHLDIEVLVAGKNINLLNTQLKDFTPKLVIIASKDDIHKVNHLNVKSGQDEIINAIKNSKSNIIVNALVGFIGLKPTIEAIKCNKKVALANKESLVVAGKFIDTSYIKPIDSEHFGLWYLMDNSKKIDSLTITASGGSFRDTPLNELKNVSIIDALKHPNWSMGDKITIDSATMTNKLFELVEARWLFNTTKCDAIIEPKSIIHAMVNFTDGSTTAHLANTSMKLPISYAILPNIDEQILEHIDILELKNLEFKKISQKRYRIWEIKDELVRNENLGVVLNASNEIAVQKFLDGKIGFLDISNMNIDTLNKFHNVKINNLHDIFEINKEVRAYCQG